MHVIVHTYNTLASTLHRCLLHIYMYYTYMYMCVYILHVYMHMYMYISTFIVLSLVKTLTS